MYVFLLQGVGAIQGLDWLWLFLAVLMDLSTIAASGYSNRNRIPAGYPGSYAEKELSAASPAQPSAVAQPAPAAPVPPAEPNPPAKRAGQGNLNCFTQAHSRCYRLSIRQAPADAERQSGGKTLLARDMWRAL
jgi:hypothetical protein